MTNPTLDDLNALPLSREFFDHPALHPLPDVAEPKTYQRTFWNLTVWAHPHADLRKLAAKSLGGLFLAQLVPTALVERDLHDGLFKLGLDLHPSAADVAYKLMTPEVLNHPDLSHANQAVLLRNGIFGNLRIPLLNREDLTDEQLLAYVTPDDFSIRLLVAEHAPRLPIPVLKVLASDSHAAIRTAVLKRTQSA